MLLSSLVERYGSSKINGASFKQLPQLLGESHVVLHRSAAQVLPTSGERLPRMSEAASRVFTGRRQAVLRLQRCDVDMDQRRVGLRPSTSSGRPNVASELVIVGTRKQDGRIIAGLNQGRAKVSRAVGGRNKGRRVTQHSKRKKKFNCEFCEQRFYSRFDLEVHTRRHVGEKPFDCSVCGKGFASRNELYPHNMIHSAKRHRCNICSKRFRSKNNLEDHCRLHTGEKPYKCSSCPLTFHSRLERHRHLKKTGHVKM